MPEVHLEAVWLHLGSMALFMLATTSLHVFVCPSLLLSNIKSCSNATFPAPNLLFAASYFYAVHVCWLLPIMERLDYI